MTAWEPVISAPALAGRAALVVERTSQFFHRQTSSVAPPRSPRLDRFLHHVTGIDGVPAVPLFFAYLALERRSDPAFEATSTWLDRAVDVTSGIDEPKPWLATGIAGCAWVVAHVLGRLADPQDDDPNEDVDETLAAFLADARGSIDAELTMGLAGLGTYYLERLPRPSAVAGLDRVMAQLREQAEELRTGITWRKGPRALSRDDRRRFPAGLYNLGIPHGVPGVTAFLARVCASEASTAVARELLEGSVTWLLAQQRPCGASLFPSLVDPRCGPVEAESRLAWCYGDLGIATTVLQAARALDRGDWELQALAIAERAACRPGGSSGVEDGMVCHGSAGIAHLFNRLYQASGLLELRGAALRWYQDTVDRYDPAGSETGYRCLVREPQDAPTDEAPIVDAESYGLAVGVAGVALVLLAGLGRVAPDWDRVLGTAIPPLRRGGGHVG